MELSFVTIEFEFKISVLNKLKFKLFIVGGFFKSLVSVFYTSTLVEVTIDELVL